MEQAQEPSSTDKLLVAMDRQNQLLENIQAILVDNQERDALISKVKVENFNMPFFAMVGLIIKWVIASIPAALVIGILWALIMLLLTIVGVRGIF